MLIQPLTGAAAGISGNSKGQRADSAQSFSEVMNKSLEKAGADISTR